MFVLRFLSTCLLVKLTSAGHADMFSCRKGKCPVTELTDSNFDIELASPTFVMFYAPWCGHCKQLAPVLKKAAKSLDQSGVKVAAVDVEPNPTVQGKFPDIRGFPTLKFLPSSNPKKAVDYQGARDESSIVEFAKAQAKKHGVVVGEPVVTKKFSELYSFMGRSALENKPVLLVLGKESESETPNWIGKLATELRKPQPIDSIKKEKNQSPEFKTKELLKEASKVTKLESVKDGISSLLDLIDSSPSDASKLSPPQVSPVYAHDMETIQAFNLIESDLPILLIASVDRKTAGGSYVLYPNTMPKQDRRGKFSHLNELTEFVQNFLPIANQGPDALLKGAESLNGIVPLVLPEFPKPPNVIAAEERERKRKEKELSIHEISNQESLDQHCYQLNGKTCVLLFVQGGAAAASSNDVMVELVKKFSKDGFSFAAMDTNEKELFTVMQQGLNLNEIELSTDPLDGILAVVKSGKRPRVSAVSGDVTTMSAHLDTVVGGSASFSKLKLGLPIWPNNEGGEEL